CVGRSYGNLAGLGRLALASTVGVPLRSVGFGIACDLSGSILLLEMKSTGGALRKLPPRADMAPLATSHAVLVNLVGISSVDLLTHRRGGKVGGVAAQSIRATPIFPVVYR